VSILSTSKTSKFFVNGCMLVILEGIETGALLDTGSTVSTISESYYQQHLACSIQLKTIKEILDIECAGGSNAKSDA
jgi:hypothetical protein